MNTESSNLVAELVATAERLLGIAKRLQGEVPQVDAAVASVVSKKLSKRLCLNCGKECPLGGEQYRRGLCVTHYTEWERMKSPDNDDLIARGLLAPVGRKKPSSFDASVRSKGKGLDAAKQKPVIDDEAEINRTAKPKRNVANKPRVAKNAEAEK